MSGLLAVAQLTWLEARRRRIVLAAMLCGLGFLAVFAIAIYFIHDAQRTDPMSYLQKQIVYQALTIVALYAVNFLVVATSVMLPVDSLSGEIAAGIMQTIASKPVRRAEILLGKWLVYCLMIAGYILVMVFGVVLIMRV